MGLRARIGACPVHILEFSRSCKEYRVALEKALLTDPALEPCRWHMARRSCELPCGAKIFVHQDQYEHVVAAVNNGNWDLKPRHIVVAADFEEAVTNAVANIPSSCQVRLKSFSGHAFQVTEDLEEPPSLVRRTFIDLDVPTSLHSGRQTEPRTQ